MHKGVHQAQLLCLTSTRYHAEVTDSTLQATVQQTWPNCYDQHPEERDSRRQAGSK